MGCTEEGPAERKGFLLKDNLKDEKHVARAEPW